MRITKLSARNFKRQSFDEILAPITLFTGLNSTGKTARIEALSLAANGYVPAEPKPIKDERLIYDLYASGNPMAVGFDTDGDLNVTRRFTEEGGSVKYSGPKGPVLPAIAMDPSVYLGLGGPERLRFMCKATAKGDKFNQAEEVAGLVSEIKNIRLENNTPASEKAIESIVSSRLKITFSPVPETSAEWIDIVMFEAKEEKKLADQTVKRMRQTVHGLAQARSETQVKQDAEIVAQAARKALKEAEAERTRISTLLEETRRQYREVNSKAAKLDPIGTEYSETVTGWTKTIERLKPIVEGPEPVAATEGDIKARKDYYEQSVIASSQLSSASARLEELLEEKESVKALTQCDKCGHKFTAAAKKKAIASVEKQIKEARANEAKLKSESEVIAEKHKEIVDRNDTKDALRQAYLNAVAETKRCQDALKESQSAAAELPALKEKGTSLGIELANQDSKVAEAKAKSDTAEKDLRELIAFRADAAQRARVIEQAEQAEAEAAVAKAFVDIVVRRQEEIIKEAVGPLVERMNEWCGHLLPFPIRYEDGELRTGQWTHRTSSDSEKLLIYAALSFAMASDSSIRIAIISRFESFDYLAQRKLMATADKLITEGKLDQCILVEVRQWEEDNELGATNFDRLKIINVRTQSK